MSSSQDCVLNQTLLQGEGTTVTGPQSEETTNGYHIEGTYQEAQGHAEITRWSCDPSARRHTRQAEQPEDEEEYPPSNFRVRLIAVFLIYISWVMVGTLVFVAVEDWNFTKSFYFCVTTVTTVGYGDVQVKTEIGKMCCIAFVWLSLGLTAGVVSASVMKSFKTSLEMIANGRRVGTGAGNGYVSEGDGGRARIYGKRLAVCLALLGSLLVVTVCVYTIVEEWSLVDALYFATATFCTVGYGQPSPSTHLSQLMTCGFVVLGVYTTTQCVAALVESLLDSEDFRSRVRFYEKRIDARRLEAMDFDRTGKVSELEFFIYMITRTGQVHYSEVDFLREVFARADLNNKGFVTAAQLDGVNIADLKPQGGSGGSGLEGSPNREGEGVPVDHGGTSAEAPGKPPGLQVHWSMDGLPVEGLDDENREREKDGDALRPSNSFEVPQGVPLPHRASDGGSVWGSLSSRRLLRATVGSEEDLPSVRAFQRRCSESYLAQTAAEIDEGDGEGEEEGAGGSEPIEAEVEDTKSPYLGPLNDTPRGGSTTKVRRPLTATGGKKRLRTLQQPRHSPFAHSLRGRGPNTPRRPLPLDGKLQRVLAMLEHRERAGYAQHRPSDLPPPRLSSIQRHGGGSAEEYLTSSPKSPLPSHFSPLILPSDEGPPLGASGGVNLLPIEDSMKEGDDLGDDVWGDPFEETGVFAACSGLASIALTYDRLTQANNFLATQETAAAAQHPLSPHRHHQFRQYSVEMSILEESPADAKPGHELPSLPHSVSSPSVPGSSPGLLPIRSPLSAQTLQMPLATHAPPVPAPSPVEKEESGLHRSPGPSNLRKVFSDRASVHTWRARLSSFNRFALMGAGAPPVLRRAISPGSEVESPPVPASANPSGSSHVTTMSEFLRGSTRDGMAERRASGVMLRESASSLSQSRHGGPFRAPSFSPPTGARVLKGRSCEEFVPGPSRSLGLGPPACPPSAGTDSPAPSSQQSQEERKGEELRSKTVALSKFRQGGTTGSAGDENV